jgi:hypothetical protein
MAALKSNRSNSIGSTNMSCFTPQAIALPNHFEITENERGYWVASEEEGRIGGVFRTQKDALRFALFEAGGDSACVRLVAGTGSKSARRSRAARRRQLNGA